MNQRERFWATMHFQPVDHVPDNGKKESIRQEVLRLKPLVDDGGFIPHVDHRCPPDVTYENYLYYLKFKRETYGIPEPEPRTE